MIAEDTGTRLPNLIVIGAKKASTTLLCQVLQQHPAIWFPSIKEPSYFANRRYKQSGEFERYVELYSNAPIGTQFRGDGSTSYTTHPHNGPIPERLQDDLNNPKLIYILRDPVERAISNYKHGSMKKGKSSSVSFQESLTKWPPIIDTSRYAMQLEQYERVFGNNAVHIVIAEEFYQSPERVLAGIERYLGLEPWDGWPNREQLPRVNSAATLGIIGLLKRYGVLGQTAISLARRLPDTLKLYLQKKFRRFVPKPTISDRERAMALRHLEEDIHRLRERLGDRIDIWPSVRMLEPRPSLNEGPTERLRSANTIDNQ